MQLRAIGAALVLALCVSVCPAATDTPPGAPPTPPDPQQTRALHALFARQWEDLAQRYPEFATYRGDERFNDRLSDLSPEAIAAGDAQTRVWLAEAQAIRRDSLSPTDRVSLEMFIGARERELLLQGFAGFRSQRLGVLDGPQSDLSSLLLNTPATTASQVRQLLARLAAVPRRMDQEIALLRRAQALGWVASQDVLARVLSQIDGQLSPAPEAGPFYAPFRKLGADIPAAERAQLLADGRAAIDNSVLPAMRKLRAFIADELVPRAPANGALSNYPDGVRVYEALVRRQTTTDLRASEIHAIGLRELARLRGEMEAVMRETRFDGDFAAFVRYLTSDPRFYFSSPEALLAGYRDIAKRIDAELPRLFTELPRAPYGVRAMPAFRGPDAAEYYDGPARDGSRAGWFNANAAGWKSRPTWGMATLTAHEAVPGHHLQIARAQELRDLPEFRRGGFGYTAFTEGWALYAETLGNQIGLYDDPYSRFGHLQAQAFRAARLVVDTGIHALGWSRQRAIDFMVERTGQDRNFITAEVDRYTSTPGQALAYMVGELKIIELRDRAKARLGARFDLRRFNNAVIDQGALPLDTLERLIDGWIAAQP